MIPPSLPPDEEVVAAVTALRARRRYPATLAAVARRLRLSATARIAFTERLLTGEVPEGLSVLRRGRTETVKLTLRGEEDFDQPLRKAEQLDLRIRLADLEARVEPADGFEGAFDEAYARLSSEDRSSFVALPALREVLAAWDRQAFDGGLVALCEADRYQLSEHEHPARLSAEERQAALAWGGRAFWFVSRV